MDTPRIAALLEPFLDRPLPASALEEISTYIDLLLRWNARVNLTAIRDAERIVTRHFGESFFLARHLFPEPVARTALSANGLSCSSPGGVSHPKHVAMGENWPPVPHVLDLGSGAGFPALPLKIWSPDIRLTLIESNHRKAAFLRETIRSLILMDINVFAGRAETLLTPNPPQADVVTLRAVEHFDIALPLAIQFLAPAARIALLIGARQLPSLGKLAPAINWKRAIRIPQSHSRLLVFGFDPGEVEEYRD
jgi:16S rRNA (guanine527-N7)-methyltransferase